MQNFRLYPTQEKTMDITDNKYIRYVFGDLVKVPGVRRSSMLYRRLFNDATLTNKDKKRIELAIYLLKINGYVEEIQGSSSVMNFVMATEDKGNKVIDYGKRVEIVIDLLGWLPYDNDRQNYGKLLFDLTGDQDSFFPATDESVRCSVSEAGIQLPSNVTDRIDIYEYVMQQTEKHVYETFLHSLSESIKNQEENVGNSNTITTYLPPSARNVIISNPIIIDKSSTTNTTVSGNGNQTIANGSEVNTNKSEAEKNSQHWLQILYWVVGIIVAFIGIYKFFLD